MTLIVGVKCSDGVVIGADSAATLGSGGQQTVKEVVTKLEIIKDTLILGVSGPVGLAQRYAGEIGALSSNELQTLGRLRGHEIGVEISKKLWMHAQPEYERAGQVAQAVRNNAPLLNAHHQTVVAIRGSGEDRLFQFSETCAPEESTVDLPYVSIGSGQANADPFLSFLRRVFWPQGTHLNVSQGIFISLWSLTQTIRSSPGGVAFPIVMAVLQNGQARMLPEAEMDEHKQAIEEAEKALHNFGQNL